MMATTPPPFDAAAVAMDLAATLGQHRAAVAPTIAAPSSDPMFTQHADGTILDRAGRVLVHGTQVKP
jgi:hypothetical protein